MRFPGPGGKIGHAELRIGDSVIMLADEFPEMDARGPKTIGGTPIGFMVYVRDCDSTFKLAVDSGAKVVHALENKF